MSGGAFDRRVFLEAILAALTGSAGASAGQGAALGARPLGASLRAARKADRPVLVVVVPRGRRELDSRWRIWAALLADAPPALFAGLDRCEIVCAGMRDVRRRVPAARGFEGEPWALLVSADGASVRAVTGDVRNGGLATRLRGLLASGEGARPRNDARAGVRSRRAPLVPTPEPPRHPCGVWIEDGERRSGAPCGSAYVPSISRRFLEYFTRR